MDVDKVDYENYPALRNLEYYRVNLTAGDCLYIPFKWLHQVRSFDRNLAVNFWFNYEKIFGNSEFEEKCASNNLDLKITLDKLNYSTSKSNNELNFK